MNTHPAPYGPDGYQYVWDFHNDCYMRVVPMAPNKDYPNGWYDYVGGRTRDTSSVTSRQLMAKYGLTLNKGDERTTGELDTLGEATLYYDTRHNVIGFYHAVGIVASIAQWRGVDWQQIAAEVP